MALAVYTGQLGTYRGADVDITLKSSHGLGRTFAPTAWDMVMGVKRGKVSEAQYREWYLDVLRDSYRARQPAWQQLLRQQRIVQSQPEQAANDQLVPALKTSEERALLLGRRRAGDHKPTQDRQHITQ